MAKIKSWETIEQNGFIYVWHHADSKPPLWKPPVIPEIENRLMAYIGRSEHVINCHIQEMMENPADYAHLECLHKFGLSSKITHHPENWQRFIQLIANISPTPVCEENFHCAKYEGVMAVKLFGIFLVRYVIIEPVEKVFGIKLDNGTWNGVIGRIQKEEADVSVNSIYATYERFQVVKFTASVGTTKILFVVSGPKQLSKLTTIIRPFSFE
ncbi:uncharacterized protein LOC111616323, partial [Centruroides sculpturatus]|uniref:uncharacterized protein LOC111616323 n=1 Tax=Centruroides sculpturatus TaxID=218467 RepID=UPI000C6E8657